MRTQLNAQNLMDGMRGLAALGVLFSHERNVIFEDATTNLSFGWKLFYMMTGLGHQAVMVFFVLSGYWITGAVTRKHEESGFTWANYIIDRLSRLWLVLIPALILGGIFDTIGRYGLLAPIYFGVQGTSIITFDVAAHLSPLGFVGNVAFLQTVFVAPFGSNGSLWSLANEFWYYIWFPPLYQLLRGRVSSPLALLVAAISMYTFRTLLPGYICWLFGSVLFFATHGWEAPERALRRPGALAATGLAFFIITMSTKWPGLRIDETIGDVFVSASFAVFLFELLRYQGTFSPRFAPLCAFGARASYSLYAIHLPLVVIMAATFLTPTRRLPPSAIALLGFVVVGVITIGCSYLFSLATEANTSALRGWLKTKYRRFRRVAI